jgi:hypothetical protein
MLSWRNGVGSSIWKLSNVFTLEYIEEAMHTCTIPFTNLIFHIVKFLTFIFHLGQIVKLKLHSVYRKKYKDIPIAISCK